MAHTTPARSHASMQQPCSSRCTYQDDLPGLCFSVTLDLLLPFMLHLEKFTFLPLHSCSAYPKQAPRAGFISLCGPHPPLSLPRRTQQFLQGPPLSIPSFLLLLLFLGPVFYSFIWESFPIAFKLLSQPPLPPYWHPQHMKINLVIFLNIRYFQIIQPEILLTL